MKRSVILGLCALSACGQQQASNDSAAAPPGVDGPMAERSASASSLVPDYPNSTSIEVPNLGLPGTDSRSGNATMRETVDTPDQVASYYRAYFQRAGTPIRADTAGVNGGLMSVARDGERGAMLTISKVGDKTRIGVIMAR